MIARGEEFDLLDQSAQVIGRYDTLKDIQRLEQVVSAVPHSSGFMLFLTNDRSYWMESARADSVDATFRLHEGRSLTGELSWGTGASAGTRKGREADSSALGQLSAELARLLNCEGGNERCVPVRARQRRSSYLMAKRLTANGALNAANNAETGERLGRYETICGPRGRCRRESLTNDLGRWTWCPDCLTVHDSP